MAFIRRISATVPADMRYINKVTDTNKYWYTMEYATESAGLCLPNCTVYVLGRLAEIAGESVKQGYGSRYPLLNRSGFGNAATWFNSTLWEKGQVPKVGAVACWTDNGNGWGGHVAIVEETDGTLAGTKLSMSGYTNASSGTRSFTNPGYTASWYFKYLDFNTSNYYYTTYNNRGGSFQGFIYNPYVDAHKTPSNLSNELITDGNIKYVEWKNSYEDGDPFKYAVTVAMDPIVWGGTNNRFNLFTSQPNSQVEGYELAAVINGNIWGNDGTTSYPMGFTKVANEAVGNSGVLQYLPASFDSGLYEDILCIGSTKASNGATLEASLYQTMASTEENLNKYVSALNGDLTENGKAYCAQGAYASAIHSFIGYNPKINTAFMGYNTKSMSGQAVITEVKSIFGADSKVVVLDGGGSTQVLLRGDRVRESSDSGGVRKVENAICIYQKKMTDVPDPVERDTTRDQIKILVDSIRIRTKPDTQTGVVIGSVTKGLVYNVLSTYNDGTYTWYQLNENAWSADNGSWIEFLPAVVETVTVTTRAIPSDAGTITGSGTYNKGDEVILTATPNEHYKFVKWENGVTFNPYQFTATENIDLDAEFEREEDPVPPTPPTPPTPGVVDNDKLDTSKVGKILVYKDGHIVNVKQVGVKNGEIIKTRPREVLVLENNSSYSLMRKYDIEFNSNGGDSVTSLDYYLGETVDLPDVQHQDVDGLPVELEGWYDSADFATKIISVGPEATGNRTYYAKWTQSKTQYKGTYVGGESVYSGAQDSFSGSAAQVYWNADTKTYDTDVTITSIFANFDSCKSDWSSYIKPEVHYGSFKDGMYTEGGLLYSEDEKNPNYVNVHFVLPAGATFGFKTITPTGRTITYLYDGWTYKLDGTVKTQTEWSDNPNPPEGSWVNVETRTVTRTYNGSAWSDWA